MEREDAISRLRLLVGEDLRPLADRYEVTVWNEFGRKNKGWAGHVLERYLNIPINSAQSPNFGSWELKLVSLDYNRNNSLKVKETMAITMIDGYNVRNTPFIESHLYAKLRKAVICARVFETTQDTRSLLDRVTPFDLENNETLRQIENDYNLIREAIRNGGMNALSSSMGTYIQARTKGSRNSTTRAFYARKILVAKILGIDFPG